MLETTENSLENIAPECLKRQKSLKTVCEIKEDGTALARTFHIFGMLPNNKKGNRIIQNIPGMR